MAKSFTKTNFCAITIVALIVLLTNGAEAQKKINCTDGEHIEMDIKQISIQYGASAFTATITGLAVFGARVEVAPKQLQQAAIGTQQWNEFLKGLVLGYNSCAITKREFAEGVDQIYPRLKDSASVLEGFRKSMADGQAVQTKQLNKVFDAYYADFRRFAQISNKVLFDRIEAVSDEVAAVHQEANSTAAQLANVTNRLEAVEKQLKDSPPAPPAQINDELKKALLARTGDAEDEYRKGYDLLLRYRFQESIPHFERALADVPLPEFYRVLGSAYRETSNLNRAEEMLRQGLALHGNSKQNEADLSNDLGQVLLIKGDLDAAFASTTRALHIDEELHGVDEPRVAVYATNMGTILRAQGHLDEALRYSLKALEIDERIFGPDHPNVADDANNVGAILQTKEDKRDLAEALKYFQKSRRIIEENYEGDSIRVAMSDGSMCSILNDMGDLNRALGYCSHGVNIIENRFGSNDPRIASFANSIGQIYKKQGNLEAALQLTQRALQIDRDTYGPDHPTVAIRENNIALILQAKGDLKGAFEYEMRALTIDEKAQGPTSPDVALRNEVIGGILWQKGDSERALPYAQRALSIYQSIYPTNHPKVASASIGVALNLEKIGELDEALQRAKNALEIDEGNNDPNDPLVARDLGVVGHILIGKHQLNAALPYLERAQKINERLYGIDDPRTKSLTDLLYRIRQLAKQ